MSESDPDSLRHRLRSDTRTAHETLDGIVVNLHLANFQDLSVFLRAHCRALTSLDLSFCGQHNLVSHQLSTVQSDIQRLQITPSRPFRGGSVTGNLDPDGVTYVIAGSHLGGKILAKQLALSEDPRVLPLQLFNDDRVALTWTNLVARLRTKPACGVPANRMVNSALTCFDVYSAAFQTEINLAKTCAQHKYEGIGGS